MKQLGVLDKGVVALVGISIDFDDLEERFEADDHDFAAPLTTLPPTFNLDAAVARAARISYQGETKQVRNDAQLIDYLMRHRHTSPFEQVSVKFRVKAPLFVVQQMLRHRTAKVNQESARYSVLVDEFYTPDSWRLQDTINKQGSIGELDEDAAFDAGTDYEVAMRQAFRTYQELLDRGVAREMARMVLPTSTYTNLVWKIDAHNLLHFLRLRLDEHAQWEIRQYAQAMYDLVKPLAPAVIEAWERHVLNARTFSSDELELVRSAVLNIYSRTNHEDRQVFDPIRLRADLKARGLRKTRQREFFVKLGLGAAFEAEEKAAV